MKKKLFRVIVGLIISLIGINATFAQLDVGNTCEESRELGIYDGPCPNDIFPPDPLFVSIINITNLFNEVAEEYPNMGITGFSNDDVTNETGGVFQSVLIEIEDGNATVAMKTLGGDTHYWDCPVEDSLNPRLDFSHCEYTGYVTYYGEAFEVQRD